MKGTLMIERVTQNDEGYYQCKVTNGNRQGTGSIHLKVIDCPEDVIFFFHLTLTLALKHIHISFYKKEKLLNKFC